MDRPKCSESSPADIAEFDQLPDAARVPVTTVAQLYGVSVATVWRWVRQSRVPAPCRVGGTTRWSVGALRRALVEAR